jgi:transposase
MKFVPARQHLTRVVWTVFAKAGRAEGAGQAAIFGMLKREGKVLAVVADDAKSNTLLLIITGKTSLGSIVYADCYHSCGTLDVRSHFINGF